MPGDPRVCRAGNALRPVALLSRLFDIPLTRLRPSLSAVAFSTSPRRLSDNEDPRARYIDTSSLSVTLEAHRRANRDYVVRKIRAEPRNNAVFRPELPDTVFFRPELPAHRFTVNLRNQEPRKQGPRKQDKRTQRRKQSPQEQRQNFAQRIPPSDYLGHYVEPLHNRDDARDEDLPWFAASLRSHATPMERLRAEMEAFEQYTRLTPEEKAARATVLKQTMDVFSMYRSQAPQNHSIRQFELQLFGSERTGLATVISDLDLRLYDPKVEETDNTDAKKAPKYYIRHRATTALEASLPRYVASDRFQQVFLRHARYPLISMQHAESGIDVQIVCSNDTSYSQELMAKYMEELPALRTLYMLFKRLLEIRGLCDVFHGGIGCYSLFYMVAAGMKLGSSAANNDPAVQLLSVLDFYSQFDATNNWISLEPLMVLPKIEKKPIQTLVEKEVLKKQDLLGLQDKDQPYLLCIRDPADQTNDLGRKTFQWKHLQATMKTLNEELRQRLEKDDDSLLLTPLVGTSFALVEARRERLAAFDPQNSGALQAQATSSFEEKPAASDPQDSDAFQVQLNLANSLETLKNALKEAESEGTEESAENELEEAEGEGTKA